MPPFSDSEQIYVTTFQHYTTKNGFNVTWVFFVQFDEADPSASALLEMSKAGLKIQPISKSGRSGDLVVDPESGEPGINFRLGPIERVEPNLVRLPVRNYFGPLAAGLSTYTLEKREGEWSVTKAERKWIS